MSKRKIILKGKHDHNVYMTEEEIFRSDNNIIYEMNGALYINILWHPPTGKYILSGFDAQGAERVDYFDDIIDLFNKCDVYCFDTLDEKLEYIRSRLASILIRNSEFEY